jgi:hypothetical protein
MRCKQLLLIVGTGRSGSSALTRTLSLCGGFLPSTVFGDHEANPKGFWEPRDAVNLNEGFLSRHKSLRDTIFPEEVDIKADDRNEFVESIRQFLSQYQVDRALIVKDPRTSILMDFWIEAASRENFSTKIVISMRNPEETVLSFIKTDPLLFREALMNYWLWMNLITERSSRNLPRVFVDYRNLMKDWRTEVRRIAHALTVDFEIKGTSVDDFLSADLYRQKHIGTINDIYSQLWTTHVYAILSAAAHGGSLDIARLDQIYDDYSRDARVFRAIFNERQRFSIEGSYKQERECDANVPTWRSGHDFDNLA